MIDLPVRSENITSFSSRPSLKVEEGTGLNTILETCPSKSSGFLDGIRRGRILELKRGLEVHPFLAWFSYKSTILL